MKSSKVIISQEHEYCLIPAIRGCKAQSLIAVNFGSSTLL
jgi:hypothetical protein